MQFYDYLNRLYENSHQPEKGLYVLQIFSALCGERNPFKANREPPFSSVLPEGLRGADSTYRKRLYKESEKGLSDPIKNHIRGCENKETFIDYLEKSVQPEIFSNLCTAFEVSMYVDNLVLFESIYVQFLRFVYNQGTEVEDIVSITVRELSKDNIETNVPVFQDADSQNKPPADSTKFLNAFPHNELITIFKDNAEYYHISDFVNRDPSMIYFKTLNANYDFLRLAIRFVDDIQSEIITAFAPYKGDMIYIKICQFIALIVKYKDYLARNVPYNSLVMIPFEKSKLEAGTEHFRTKLKSLYNEICYADTN